MKILYNDEIIIFDNPKTELFIKINRKNEKYDFVKREKPNSLNNYDLIKDNMKCVNIKFILGKINLTNQTKLILCKESKQIGSIFGDKKIEKIDEYILFDIKKKLISNQTDLKSTQLIKNVLLNFNLLFSFDFDVSKKSQIQFDPKLKDLNLYFKLNNNKNYNFLYNNNEFIWNSYLSKDFNNSNFKGYVYPVINGFFSTFEYIKEKNIIKKISIISRISCKRNGRRLFCRGIDKDGNVANFVETEVIIENNLIKENQKLRNKKIISFITIRGSVPLYWSQKPDFSKNPLISVKNINKSEKVFEKHFLRNFRKYGSQIVINLVKKTGIEEPLQNEYKKSVEIFNSKIKNKKNSSLEKDFQINDKNNNQFKDNEIKYIHFDLHNQCKNYNFTNLDVINNFLYPFYEQMFFEADVLIDIDQSEIKNVLIIRKQEICTRVNCKDSLDRTNVVQSYIAQKSIKSFLLMDLNKVAFFKEAMAENGDFLSIQYAGTPAINSEFTRLGYRTISGVLNDGLKSLKRYYFGNFSDGDYQDGLNLILGKIKLISSNNLKKDQNNNNAIIKNLKVFEKTNNPLRKTLKFNLKVSALAFLMSFLGLRKFFSHSKSNFIQENHFWKEIIIESFVSFLFGIYMGFKININEPVEIKE